jgi:mannose-6-phosphate isomerase-like protein (cupin superfamily)
MQVKRSNDLKSFIAKDGSEIIELFRSANMGMAESVVGVGEATARHYHRRSVEIHYILEGHGLIEMSGEKREVSKGEVIIIPKMKIHLMRNIGDLPLRFLCLYAPSYNDDTVLVGLHKRENYLLRFLPRGELRSKL